MEDEDVKVCPTCGTKYDLAAVFCQLDGGRLGFPDQPPDPFVGRTLLDQFVVQEVLGAGGMGTVYRARQTSIDRDVAIKILHPELTQNADAVRRFQREAKVSSRFDHPNVVKVYLFGQLPDDRSLYIVMPYLKGQSLQDLIRNRGALPVQRALHIATQLCDGVGEAHRHAVVHRDVKPENVILVERGGDPDFVKVLDFGIARFSSGEQTVATQTGLIFGTARYISPEGASGEPTDARSDVYSIGVLVYQLLAGETPFDSTSPVALLMKHINEKPPDIRSRPLGKDVPPHVADVVMRTLAKNPEARPDDANVLALMLREAALADGVSLPVARLSNASQLAARSTAPPTIRGAPAPALTPSAPHAPPSPHHTEVTGPTGPMGPSPTLSNAPSPFDPTGQLSVPGLRSGGRLGAFGTVLVAFVLGAVAVTAGAWALTQIGSNDSVDVEDLEARARAALRRGDIDSPAGDNVADLTGQILEEAPEHQAARDLRREAARRLREEAATAIAQGFVDEARSRYRRALVLVPEDRAARDALTQLEAASSGPPQRTYEVGLRVIPPQAAVGEPMMLVAVLANPLAEDAAPFFYLDRNGRNGQRVPAQRDEEGHRWMATYQFTRSGEYDLAFHEGGDEARFRLALAVAPRGTARRPTDPPVTTQQPSMTGPRSQPAVTTPNDGIDWRLPGEQGRDEGAIRTTPAPTPAPTMQPTTQPTMQPTMQSETTPPPAPWQSGMVI